MPVKTILDVLIERYAPRDWIGCLRRLSPFEA